MKKLFKRKSKTFAKIRRHHKRYHRLRSTGRFMRRIGHWLSYLKHVNPFHYLTRIDRYIIKKFIGTYI